MPRVDKTPRAKTDLVEIWCFIAKDNPDAADALVDSIEDRLKQLSNVPLSSEAVPHIGVDVRRSTVGNYVLYIRPIADGVQVIRVLHGARQPEDLI
jgi:toxin ParE1/3/4